MKLRWLPHARADLRAIRAHVAEDSSINADRLLDKLIRRAERIPDFPQAGRVVPEFALDDVRRVAARYSTIRAPRMARCKAQLAGNGRSPCRAAGRRAGASGVLAGRGAAGATPALRRLEHGGRHSCEHAPCS
ncbi:MAG: type II toxin-antitoxin system RelE/ParE family toxin [Halofilum sp. (in: g-proteobacteria)]|nr:type II toxin-antitoxin system RelE/ParE family toxin [Halofilum sp. (in: g-proteobacteria)]